MLTVKAVPYSCPGLLVQESPQDLSRILVQPHAKYTGNPLGYEEQRENRNIYQNRDAAAELDSVPMRAHVCVSTQVHSHMHLQECMSTESHISRINLHEHSFVLLHYALGLNSILLNF